MSLKIYNTLAKDKEPFIPLVPGKVGMYVCGVTVYDSCHIGHARAAVVFDVIFRYLKFKGLDVTYVRNFTDIDDKIIKRTHELGIDYKTLTSKYIQEYLDEMRMLGVIDPNIQPKATENIHEMIGLIEGLIHKGVAYVVEGDVYFEVQKFPAYGRLSKRGVDDMKTLARISADERKLHPGDFALWKASKPNEPSWPSPWGSGRPGWHIECSAMSMRFLGAGFDIHGGGSDLIFPHHENEIAQSESYSGKHFAHYWLHNEMILIDQTKMSKSLGNVFILKELLKKYPPRIIRYFLISKHYRTPMDFSFEALDESVQAYERLESSWSRIQSYLEGVPICEDTLPAHWMEDFVEAMDDDFNTPKTLGVMFRLLLQLNQAMDHQEKRGKISAMRDAMSKMLDVLGLEMNMDRFKKYQSESPLDEIRVYELLSKSVFSEDDVEYLAKARESARRLRLWKLSDNIRDALRKHGIEIQDEKNGVHVIRLVRKK